MVSATFAASMVISPALGAYIMDVYSESVVVALATAIALLDVFFILVAVPESLPEKVRPSSWGAPISWEQADPFAVMGFSVLMVAVFIATVGILSVGAQLVLGFLMKSLGSKHTIMLGLLFEMLQLMWYGFGSQTWMMWAAGTLASISSITYPAISAFVSMHSDADKQGLVQGMVTGMRGLCNGLGPAMFGIIFYLFHVDLNYDPARYDNNTSGQHMDVIPQLVPGPPFVFGAFLVICALLVAAFIPEGSNQAITLKPTTRRQSGIYNNDYTSGLSMEVHYEMERCKKHDGLSPLSPLVDSSALL
ncbi:unnamed protein product [Nezara viridula]|uniref:Hippocampus abundant transcript 1 protein n=1 Tax=Nezara viridula TaxID=85310 RepID=A0A9P0H3R8_NEZVI|nr:unnamed protein product [Nezara viridula]